MNKMKSIKRLFKKVQAENPGWGTNVILANVVYGRNFSKDRIARMFKELVDKDEYSQSDKKALLEFLYLHTKGLKRTENEVSKPITDDLPPKDDDCIESPDLTTSKPIPPEELPF